METGQIVKIISNLYTIKIKDELLECRACGRFRKEKITPLVGDICQVDKENKYIIKILTRKNYLFRPSIANVDIALIVTSLRTPDFSAILLDKLISIVTLHDIKPILCFSKIDLLNNDEKKEFDNLKKYYEDIGYLVFQNNELEEMKKALQNKLVVVTGQTGAGKSTLLNHFDSNLALKTSPISKALNRGVHTTRHTEIYPISNFYIADTPGFSSLDITNYTKEDIKKSFVEFSKYTCRFKDCNHIKEPGCEVLENVSNGKIKKSRYQSYLTIVSEVSK